VCWLDLAVEYDAHTGHTTAIQIICYSITIVKCLYPSTLANLTLIILFSELLKFFQKFISSKSKKIVNDISEYLGIFHLLKWKFQN
jgi:hypothetical protein